MGIWLWGQGHLRRGCSLVGSQREWSDLERSGELRGQNFSEIKGAFADLVNVPAAGQAMC